MWCLCGIVLLASSVLVNACETCSQNAFCPLAATVETCYVRVEAGIASDICISETEACQVAILQFFCSSCVDDCFYNLQCMNNFPVEIKWRPESQTYWRRQGCIVPTATQCTRFANGEQVVLNTTDEDESGSKSPSATSVWIPLLLSLGALLAMYALFRNKRGPEKLAELWEERKRKRDTRAKSKTAVFPSDHVVMTSAPLPTSASSPLPIVRGRVQPTTDLDLHAMRADQLQQERVSKLGMGSALSTKEKDLVMLEQQKQATLDAFTSTMRDLEGKEMELQRMRSLHGAVPPTSPQQMVSPHQPQPMVNPYPTAGYPTASAYPAQAYAPVQYPQYQPSATHQVGYNVQPSPYSQGMQIGPATDPYFTQNAHPYY